MSSKKAEPKSSVRRSRVYKKKAPVRSSRERSRFLSPALSALGTAAGGYLGGPQGALLGRQIGSSLGEGIKSLTGFGDYVIKENSLYSVSPGNPPSIMNGALPGGSIVISHKEYLGDVISSSSANTFDIKSYEINPGISRSYPFLSQLAQNFQQYKVMGMIYEYRTMSADALNSTNTSLGQIIMATNYDALSPDYASKAEMENSAYAQSVKPSVSCVHYIECDTSTMPISELYVRGGSIPNNSDKRMYDLGRFQIATNGFQGTSVNAGELWCSYQIMLLKPKIWDALGQDVDYYTCIQDGTCDAAAPIGAVANMIVPPISPYTGQVNNLNVTFDSNLIIRIPGSTVRKYYNIIFLWRGSSTASLVAPTLTYTNAASDGGQFTTDGGATFVAGYQMPATSAGAASSRLEYHDGFRTSGTGLDVLITLGTSATLPSSTDSCQIIIYEQPYGARRNV
jgi:hypothetical protein